MKLTRLLTFTALATLVLALGAHAVDPVMSAAKDTSSFAPTIANSSKPPSPGPEGMVWIPGGQFSMGSEGKCDGKSCCSPATVADALPIHPVYVDGFWMDTTDVTNAQFEKFVQATGYVTIAERAPTKEEFPTAPPENLVAGSVVFPPPRNPSRWMITTNGGAMSKAQTGSNRKVHRATSRAKKTIRSRKSPTLTR